METRSVTSALASTPRRGASLRNPTLLLPCQQAEEPCRSVRYPGEMVTRYRDPRHGLTWSLDWLFGGGVLPLVLNGGGIRHPRGGAVLSEVVLQPLDGAVKLDRADLEVHCHEI